MGEVKVVALAPAFRFEILLALGLLTSEQDHYMEVAHRTQREFVGRWYDPFADIRDVIDTAMAPGRSALCYFLRTREDTVAAVQDDFGRLHRELSEGASAELRDRIAPGPPDLWREAAAALVTVLPEFHAWCFREEWERWRPVLEESATRMRSLLARVDPFPCAEQFSGRDYGLLEAALHPSEFVRPSAWVIPRDSRITIVKWHGDDDIWTLVGLVHESGHVLFHHPDWYEAGRFTVEDMAWLESLIPPGWQEEVGYGTVRNYFEETFLEAFAFSAAGRLLPDQRERVREQVMQNFRDRGLVLLPAIYEATEADYDPADWPRYDDFLTQLVRSRRISAAQL